MHDSSTGLEFEKGLMVGANLYDAGTQEMTMELKFSVEKLKNYKYSRDGGIAAKLVYINMFRFEEAEHEEEIAEFSL